MTKYKDRKKYKKEKLERERNKKDREMIVRDKKNLNGEAVKQQQKVQIEMGRGCEAVGE